MATAPKRKELSRMAKPFSLGASATLSKQALKAVGPSNLINILCSMKMGRGNGPGYLEIQPDTQRFGL